MTKASDVEKGMPPAVTHSTSKKSRGQQTFSDKRQASAAVGELRSRIGVTPECVAFVLQGVHGEEIAVEAEVAAAREDNSAGGVRFSVCVVQVNEFLFPAAWGQSLAFFASVADLHCMAQALLRRLVSQLWLPGRQQTSSNPAAQNLLLLASDGEGPAGAAAHGAHLLRCGGRHSGSLHRLAPLHLQVPGEQQQNATAARERSADKRRGQQMESPLARFHVSADVFHCSSAPAAFNDCIDQSHLLVLSYRASTTMLWS